MTKKEHIESLEQMLKNFSTRLFYLETHPRLRMYYMGAEAETKTVEPKPKAIEAKFIGFEKMQRELEAMRMLNESLTARIERLERWKDSGKWQY